jgi:hypothetical protein
MRKLSLSMVIAFAMLYLLESFYFLSIDPSLWSMEGRGLFCFIASIIDLYAVCMYILIKHQNKSK